MLTKQANNPRKNILFVTNPSSRAACRRLELERAGWGVTPVAEFIEALSVVRNRRVDLALLDLPADDAVATDLPNVLRGVAPAAYLPVIIVADTAAEQQRCRFLDAGADDVVCLATSGGELVARVGAMLRIKDLHDQLAVSRVALQEALRRERKLLAKLKRDNANLQTLVTTDSLTHVENRRSFQDILLHEFKIARRYNQPLSLLALDVDHFKMVNDCHGHPSGDYVLKEFAVILKQSVRESDVVARTGGEEFSILLPKAGPNQAASLAQRVREAVAGRRFNIYGRTIRITTSVGLATYPNDAEITEPDMLAYLADQALLVAKETGRDRVTALCDVPMAVRSRWRLRYEQRDLTGQETAPCPQELATNLRQTSL
jgi:diguanylate cyclase (GGDEF)-like protein